jgi:hypothetical protein
MVGNNKKKAAVGRQTSGTRNLLLVVEFCLLVRVSWINLLVVNIDHYKTIKAQCMDHIGYE